MNDEIETFNELIRAFSKQTISSEIMKEKNFFAVAGFPHYENVASNILRFLFDTQEEHGLNDLWLKSLLEVYQEKHKNYFFDIDGLEVINILREFSLNSSNRIDLLIECESLLIVIENKLYASLYNDLADYTKIMHDYRKTMKNKDVPIIKIVLSLFPVKGKNMHDFYNITYDELFKKIEKHENEYSAVGKWGLFNQEFIDNLKFKKESTIMNFENGWLNFVTDNKQELARLLEVYEADLEKRVSLLKSLDQYIEQFELNVTHGVYKRYDSPYYSQYNDIVVNQDSRLCIETYIFNKYSEKPFENFSTLYIALWNRKSKSYLGYEKILEAMGKGESKKNTNAWGLHYILDEIDLRAPINIEELAGKIQLYVQQIQEFVKIEEVE